jgi:hypothetical protein
MTYFPDDNVEEEIGESNYKSKRQDPEYFDSDEDDEGEIIDNDYDQQWSEKVDTYTSFLFSPQAFFVLSLFLLLSFPPSTVSL